MSKNKKPHKPTLQRGTGGISNIESGLEFHQGPIPPASELARYAQVLPDAPDRILKLTEANTKALIELEKGEQEIRRHVSRSLARERMIAAIGPLLIPSLGMVLTVVLALLDVPTSIPITTGIVSVGLTTLAGVIVFVYRQFLGRDNNLPSQQENQ